MLADELDYVVGVDTHRDEHVLVAVAARGDRRGAAPATRTAGRARACDPRRTDRPGRPRARVVLLLDRSSIGKTRRGGLSGAHCQPGCSAACDSSGATGAEIARVRERLRTS